MQKTEIYFDKGTLVLKKVPEQMRYQLAGMKWDARTLTYRAPAYDYRQIVLQLRKHHIPYQDFARQFSPQEFPFKESITPHPYQQEAIDAWLENGCQGVITLPTGSGKTIVAVLLIQQTERPTLIHVPTIDLMHQWYAVLQRYFDQDIGLFGGGYNEIAPLTVATYQSAALHVPYKGNQFGLVVFDECHHLPGTHYQYTAISTIAPFRLGLTATPRRADGKEERLYQLVGPLVYEAHIHQLKGGILASYQVVTLELELSAEEREQYEAARKRYLDFLSSEGINLAHPNGWKTFLWKSSQTPAGREAFRAYLTQKQLGLAAQAKLEAIWKLIAKHRGDRILIFTQDNEMAYRIGRHFFLPVLTHQTKLKERAAFLAAFRDGTYSILVTSKVLNEGVDVPEANVAIVVSGSGSVREHVQRLGRILRGRKGKQAVLYELVSKGTSEYFINQRRRRHHAYQRPDSL
ncbi:MAG: DEAD/DEAH box helicase family protein [Candidatus Poribacteria bacterium]|nr:DEAD/DEAH box helicase family protein [Candidatus Poribacteria bacterium]